jgi:hypothetical protein
MGERLKRHGGGKPFIELAGQRFGELFVVDRAEKPNSRFFSAAREVWWRCRCESCGALDVMTGRRIRAGTWRCRCVAEARDRRGRFARVSERNGNHA